MWKFFILPMALPPNKCYVEPDFWDRSSALEIMRRYREEELFGDVNMPL